MEIEASLTNTAKPPFLLNIDAQPPPFQCNAAEDPAGYWDEATQLVYENTTFANSFGRTTTEGCCFWGRGALLTRGTVSIVTCCDDGNSHSLLRPDASAFMLLQCNYGKLNFHLGAQAAAENRPSVYPDIDFCSTPQAVCSDESKEMRYVAGMFEWIDRVQDYYDSTLDWSYRDELYKFVDSGLDDDSFIDSVSNIVTRGCHVSHASQCSASTYTSIQPDQFLYGFERRRNFKNIIQLVFDLPVSEPKPVNNIPWVSGTAVTPEDDQTRRPSFRPTPYPTEVEDPTASPVISSTPRPTGQGLPTGSPIERSDLTQYNDGEIYMINDEASSYIDESIIVSRNTTLIMETGGYLEAPLNTDWPAVR